MVRESHAAPGAARTALQAGRGALRMAYEALTKSREALKKHYETLNTGLPALEDSPSVANALIGSKRLRQCDPDSE